MPYDRWEGYAAEREKLLRFLQDHILRSVGSGIVTNGELVYGADGFAGEIGHTTIEVDGRKCGCGNYGCLEAYASGPAIAPVLASPAPILPRPAA